LRDNDPYLKASWLVYSLTPLSGGGPSEFLDETYPAKTISIRYAEAARQHIGRAYCNIKSNLWPTTELSGH